MSILLVDDDHYAREIFQIVMEHHEIPFTIVSDAEDALVYLRDNNPDVVVMDIFLPGMDGYQAVQEIRKTTRGATCKVVATTAYYTNDTPQEVRTRGFDGFIPKPFTPSGLVSYLQSVHTGVV